VKPHRLGPELRWKSYSFCHVDSLLETPLCPNSGCQESGSTPVFVDKLLAKPDDTG
jgi:hypothetical protein